MRTLTLFRAFVKDRKRFRGLTIVERGWYQHSDEYRRRIRLAGQEGEKD
jgi:hypothetical protein